MSLAPDPMTRTITPAELEKAAEAGTLDPISLARRLGEREVKAVAARVDANQPERDSLAELEQLVRHGYKFIDITVRKDGRDYRFEGDWLARLLRPTQQEWEAAIARIKVEGE